MHIARVDQVWHLLGGLHVDHQNLPSQFFTHVCDGHGQIDAHGQIDGLMTLTWCLKVIALT